MMQRFPTMPGRLNGAFAPETLHEGRDRYEGKVSMKRPFGGMPTVLRFKTRNSGSGSSGDENAGSNCENKPSVPTKINLIKRSLSSMLHPSSSTSANDEESNEDEDLEWVASSASPGLNDDAFSHISEFDDIESDAEDADIDAYASVESDILNQSMRQPFDGQHLLLLGTMILLVGLGTFPNEMISSFYFLGWLFACCIVYLYGSTFLGWLTSMLITKFALHGYPLSFGSLTLSPWISRGRLNVRLFVEDFSFSNPEGFPHKHFLSCDRVELILSVRLRDLPGIITCQRRNIPIKRNKNFQCIAVIDVPFIEFDHFSINFELCNKRFNINELTRELAEREVLAFLLWEHRKAYWPHLIRSWQNTLRDALSIQGLGKALSFTLNMFVEEIALIKARFTDNDGQDENASRVGENGEQQECSDAESMIDLVHSKGRERFRRLRSYSLDNLLFESVPFEKSRNTSGLFDDAATILTHPSLGDIRRDRREQIAQRILSGQFSGLSDKVGASPGHAAPKLGATISRALQKLKRSRSKSIPILPLTPKPAERAQSPSSPKKTMWRKVSMPLKRAASAIPVGVSLSPSRGHSKGLDSVAERSGGGSRRSGKRNNKISAYSAVSQAEQYGIQLPNRLEVTVVRARDLPAADHNIFTGKRSSDPKVTVRLRDQSATTAVRFNTIKPMYNETFEFHVTDPSTVLHIAIVDKDLMSSGDFLGQWIMTLKYLLLNPHYCWHNTSNFSVERAGKSDVTIKGWFPLMSKRWDKRGECGEIELRIRWHYSDKLDAVRQPSKRTALANLECNGRETQLRMGNKAKVTKMLSSIPVLFNIQRVTVHDVEFFLQDLFRGSKGSAERLRKRGKDSDAAGKVKIPCIAWRTAFRPRRAEPGITVYAVAHAFFVKGLLPKVFNQRILGGALSQTTMGFAAHFANNVQQVFRNGNIENFASSVLTGGAFKKGIGGGGNAIKKCAVHMKKKIQGEQDGHVNAEDEEFLLESTLEGYLEKTSVQKKSELNAPRKNLRECFFQLKGRGLFYTPTDASNPRKILMNKVQLIALDRDKHSIYIHLENKITILHVPSYFDLGQDNPVEAEWRRDQELLDWFATLKELGVNFTILN